MKALEMLAAYRGRPVPAGKLRAISSALGLELARGRIDAPALIEELAWCEVTTAQAPALESLKDLLSAYGAERGSTAAAAPALARVPADDLSWAILETLAGRLVPSTAADLAEDLAALRVHETTVYRRLSKLEKCALVERASEAPDRRSKPFALTELAIEALSHREQRASGHTPDAERDELAVIVRRPVDKLDMRPHERTLYWALLHWAGALFERVTWTAADAADARALGRMLIALGHPDANQGFGDVSDNDLLHALWRYRDLAVLVDDDLSFERELLALAPADDHPGRLAWAIAAIRVARSTSAIADRAPESARRADIRRLAAALGDEATRSVITRTEPLAVFWRAPEAEIDDALAAAPLGVALDNPVAPSLELCRAHLRVVARSNRAWEPVARELEEMWNTIWSEFRHVQSASHDDKRAWVAANAAIVGDRVRAYIAEYSELEICIDRYVRVVDFARASADVPTIARDPNLTAYHCICQGLLELAPEHRDRPELRAELGHLLAAAPSPEPVPAQRDVRPVQRLESAAASFTQDMLLVRSPS